MTNSKAKSYLNAQKTGQGMRDIGNLSYHKSKDSGQGMITIRKMVPSGLKS